jgi:hypothetical protein
MSHANLNRRTLVTGAAALPALTVSVVASEVIGPNHPDADLLRLGAELEPVIDEWLALCAIGERRQAAWEAACIAAGLPRREIDSFSDDDEWREYEHKRSNTRADNEEEDEVDEHGASVVWNRHFERRNPLVQDILSRKSKTVAGLAVQARAMTLYYSELWDDPHDGTADYRKFIEAVCAFAGVTPAPLLNEQARNV